MPVVEDLIGKVDNVVFDKNDYTTTTVIASTTATTAVDLKSFNEKFI